MEEIKSPEDLEKLFKYQFKEKDTLIAALTRTAYLNEHKEIKNIPMDSLGTLGDSVLSVVVLYKLFNERRNPDKGKLTIEKSENVRREKTREFAEKHHLHQYVRWGAGEKLNEVWKSGDKSYDMVTEALIGAVFLDAQTHDKNGFEKVLELLERLKFFDNSI